MENMPQRITVQRRLRPLRLAFLVQPNDRKALTRVFEINTCLWGGRHNAIVPVFQRTPEWWADKPLKPPKAADIVLGYLDAFEPDFIVAMDTSLTIPPSIEADRVLGPADVLDPTRDEHLGYGVSACDIYHDLYKRTYRFVQRHPRKVGLPTTRRGRYQLFAAALCGWFPADDELSYYARNYRDALEAVDLPIDPAAVSQVISGKIRTPLQIASSNLKVQRYGWRGEPVLFVLDITKPRDLIDYWNLRALGKRVFPVPIQWHDELLDSCAKLIRWHYVPNRWNPQIMHRTEVMGSRSLDWDDVSAFIKKLDLPGKDAILGGHYPRIWDEWARDKDGVIRCSLEAGESEDEVSIEDQRISFRLASPSFETSIGSPNAPMWANVVHLRHYGMGDELATILPEGMPDLDRLLDTMQFHKGWTRVSSEGIVSISEYAERTVFWRLRDGVSVIQAWLKSRGFDAELSGAGRICLQVIRQLEGILGAGLLTNSEILQLLDKMAHGMVETESADSDQGGPKPKTRGRTASWSEWWGLLRKIHGDKRWAERDFARLVDRGVLRVGLKLACPVCSQANWYPNDQLADQLQCERCLQSFPFPAHKPPNQAWEYRTQGPFSIENYAQGAYSVAITLRFLLLLMDNEGTWSPSLVLRDETGRESEIDFAVWCRRHRDFDDPNLIIGECKSFKEEFEPRDIRRAKELAKQFPGALLVFATLRPELTDKEKRRLTSLARAGRHRIRTDKWRTPVMVLTAVELMARMGPPFCWKDAGGRFEQFGKHYRGHRELIDLCDATQQLHLGMEPDAESQRQYFVQLERRSRSRRQSNRQ